ncbi:MAG: S-layer homology domain-containing protein, partial [Clostridiales Family XIII bacterium]|nr:S-layer homology domain-containing protein [Clostridiales Family XIII bacterium]
ADSPRTSGGFDAYDDAGDVSAWAEEAMAWAVESGLITGRTETTLAPSGTATRAEAAAMLQRYLEKAV